MINRSIPDAILPIITLHARSRCEPNHTYVAVVGFPAGTMSTAVVGAVGLACLTAQFQGVLHDTVHHNLRCHVVSAIADHPSPKEGVIRVVQRVARVLHVPQLLQVFTAELIL
jgi:hypothetical protein